MQVTTGKGFPPQGRGSRRFPFAPSPSSSFHHFLSQNRWQRKLRPPLSAAATDSGAISSNYTRRFFEPLRPPNRAAILSKQRGENRDEFTNLRHKQPTVEKTQNTGEPSPDRHENKRQRADELASPLFLLYLQLYFTTRLWGGRRRRGIGNRIIPQFSRWQTRLVKTEEDTAAGFPFPGKGGAVRAAPCPHPGYREREDGSHQ